ncbi:MAG TPA: Ig-like domain-containing protein [Kofleriaceae bacterium]|nr:Ig-like domain-containing protein [Kofleriaceae bacterium]
MKLFAYLALASGLTLAACSPITPKGDGDGGNDPDANTNDGGGGDDAAPGMVTARALDMEGNPLAGVNVAFSQADGTLIGMATTTASGEVTETVSQEAIVSFGLSETQPKSNNGLYTVQIIMGVQPGDTVEVNMGSPFGGRLSESLGTANLMFPSLHAGTDHYIVGNKCNNTYVSNTTLSFPMDFYSNSCSGRATTLDLLGVAWNANNAPLAWTMFEDVQIGAANTFTSTGWNTNFAQFNAFYTNTPYDGEIRLDVGLMHDGIDHGIGGFNRTVGPLTAGQNAAYVVPVPAAFTDSLHVKAEYTGTARDRLLMHQTNLMSTTTSNSVDLSGLGYPSISSVTLDTSMPGRPAYRWTADGAIPSAAHALLGFSLWSDLGSQWAVLVLAPADSTAPLRMPALPNTFLADPLTLSPRWPPPAALEPWQNVVALFESGDHADFAALRTQRGLTGLIGNGQFLSPTAPIGSRSIVSAGGLFGN